MCQATPGQPISDMAVTQNVFASDGYVWSVYLGGETGAWSNTTCLQRVSGSGPATALPVREPRSRQCVPHRYAGISDNGGTSHAGWTSNHNLNSGWSETGGVTGTPVLVGGATPTSYAGYVLSPSSPGYHAGSDGSSMGITP